MAAQVSQRRGIASKIDGLVRKNIFPNRSRAIQEAVKDKIEKISKTRLARECAKLHSEEEIGIAEEGMDLEFDEWPEY